jgi:hypothetical protein
VIKQNSKQGQVTVSIDERTLNADGKDYRIHSTWRSFGEIDWASGRVCPFGRWQGKGSELESYDLKMFGMRVSDHSGRWEIINAYRADG